MFKKQLLWAAAGLALTALAARAQSATFTPQDLVGTWTSLNCETLEVPGQQPSFLKRIFTFTETTWQLQFTLFADPGCTVPLLTSRLSGPYALGAVVVGLRNTRQITWGQTAKFIAPQAAPILETMNQNTCGDISLALGVERDVSLTGCLPLGTPSVEAYGQEYDLVRLERGQLWTGLRRPQMNLETNRPTELFPFPLRKR